MGCAHNPNRSKPVTQTKHSLAELLPALLYLLRRQPIDISRPPPKNLLPDAVGTHELLGYPHRIAVEELG